MHVSVYKLRLCVTVYVFVCLFIFIVVFINVHLSELLRRTEFHTFTRGRFDIPLFRHCK